MPTVTYTLDKITEWLTANVCSRVKLKSAPVRREQEAKAYEFELVHPEVFPLYVPTRETKPPDLKSTMPSICVQFVEGSDDAWTQKRTTRYRLSLAAWNPGTHGPDVFNPTDGGEIGPAYIQGDPGTFTPNHDGWRDLFNFLDVALREIESAHGLGGYELADEIKYGLYDEEGAIRDYYPAWFAWIEVGLTTPLTIDRPAINDLL